jgi:hypothetical protein
LWDEALPESSVTLPRWGMMLDGVLYQQKTAELPTRESEFGLLLPTPVKTQTNESLEVLAAQAKRHRGHIQMRLQSLAMHFTNPRAIKDQSNTALIQKWEQQYAVFFPANPMFPTPTAKANMMAPSMQKWPAHQNLWPTPTAHNAKEGGFASELNRNTVTLSGQAGGKLNPMWVEWLMGWPIGYTSLDALATDRYQQWRQQHGECSDE